MYVLKSVKKFLDLKKVYIIVFASLAGWTLFAYFTMTNMIENQNTYAKIINLSGKQRMLSQKTTLIAKRYFETNDAFLKSHLRELIDLMKSDHKWIIKNLYSKKTNEIYFKKPINLNKKVNDYINLLEDFYTTKDKNTLEKIEDISFKLLPKLNDAVNIFEKESESKTRELIERELFILFGTLLTLLLEAIFIVIPSINRTKKKEKIIKKLNQNLELRINKALKQNRKKDRMLQQQFHLAAMAEMLNNISHQWRQPLSMISTMTSTLKIEKELEAMSDESFKEKTDIILDKTNYLSTIIDEFKEYISPDIKNEQLNLTTTIEKTISILISRLENSNIKIITSLVENNIYLKGDAVKFSTALINILNNSIEFLEQREVKEPFIKIRSKKLKDKIQITIEDNAKGIEEEIMGNIFDIYFTTKHQSQGTGLGLYISYEIIRRQFLGTIHAKNSSKGAVFTIEIPQG